MNQHFNKPVITHKLIEIIGNNFSYEEIIVIGKRFTKDFDIRIEENQYGRLRLPPHTASEYLMDFFRKSRNIHELVRFLIDLDCHSLNGREVVFDELEDFLIILRQNGIGYDFKSRTFYFVSEKDAGPKWEECLQENKEYEFSYVSVDIVKSSELIRREDIKLVYHTVNSLYELFKDTAHSNNGSIWSWQGDGGIVAFWGEHSIPQSLFFSMEVLGLLLLFNAKDNRFANDINLRFGIDRGWAFYKRDKGSILSNNINFAAHLEKKCTDINSITISERIYDVLSNKQRSYFRSVGRLDGTRYYTFSPCSFYMGYADVCNWQSLEAQALEEGVL
jgi:class 3 adenylate cyclase